VFSRPAPQHKVTKEEASAEAMRASRIIHRALRRGDMKNAARHIAREQFWLKGGKSPADIRGNPRDYETTGKTAVSR
jgi:hypothetical protein